MSLHQEASPRGLVDELLNVNPSMADLVTNCREILKRTWQKVVSAEGNIEITVELPEELKQAVRRSVNSKTKSYRYVLPTQLVAKLADSSLDSRCLQSSRGGKGAFDARSVGHKVTVPFDKENENVLGGSPEPYVNNPLRRPEITSKYRHQQKDKTGWDDLCFVLQKVEEMQDVHFTTAVFKLVLLEIYNRLAQVKVTYPVPKRISLDQTKKLIENFIAQGSGGDRVLAIATALLETAGRVFNLYSKVRRFNINAPDTTSGLVADIECLDKKGEIALAVEVKDRILTFSHIQDKMPDVRSHSVSEILFLAQKGMISEDIQKVEGFIRKEFISGQNIYIFSLSEFAPVLLALMGERGRREFLVNVGQVLDKYESTLKDRQAWAELLGSY